MRLDTTKWESALQTDDGLNERLKKLDFQGIPATKKGDLLSIMVRNQPPLVVGWDGHEIHVNKRESKRPFCRWTMDEESFNHLFLGGSPPLLVAMINDQDNVKMGTDHHNGALVLSFMVILQECMQGGAQR